MKDYKIAGFEYSEACEKAKQYCEIKTIDDPDPALVKVMDSIMAQILSKVSFSANDMALEGFFLYRAADQKDLYDRSSLALTCPNDENTACVIGVSTEAFDKGTVEFLRILAIHELTHRCGTMAHDETFQLRLNQAMEEFYLSEKYRIPVRTDAACSRIQPTIWRI